MFKMCNCCHLKKKEIYSLSCNHKKYHPIHDNTCKTCGGNSHKNKYKYKYSSDEDTSDYEPWEINKFMKPDFIYSVI